MTRFDTILQTCPDLFKYHDIYKHVQTCSNITIQFDTILQTCPDMLKYAICLIYKISIAQHDAIFFLNAYDVI